MTNKKRWVIIGATSAIAQAFARQVAADGFNLLLIARDSDELQTIAADCQIRYSVHCDSVCIDLEKDTRHLVNILSQHNDELYLFLAASSILENNALTSQNIDTMLQVNVLSLTQIIHVYWQKQQINHRIIFLSSVAACRGRYKNSLYGGSKALIEIFLQGLQQQSGKTQHITIARLGFIDTVQTYGKEGIFYAASPVECARVCYQANSRSKRQFYYPFFWRYIMWIIRHLPFAVYQRLKS